MPSDLFFALVALLITLIGATHYFFKVKKHATPKMPLLFIAFLLAASLTSLISLYLTITSVSLLSVFVIAAALMPIMMTIVFYIAFKEGKPPLGNIQVKVGDQILPFYSTRFDGNEFNSKELSRQRVLLKFYRGAWCPYCSSELKMFEEMKPLFDQYNVRIVALSNDDKASVKQHIKRDKLNLTLLSDPKLKVIRQYGVEHHKALGGEIRTSKTLFGLPFPMILKYKSMAIPTSILIDENGVVQWIDQSDDVRIRASKKNIEVALSTSFA